MGGKPSKPRESSGTTFSHSQEMLDTVNFFKDICLKMRSQDPANPAYLLQSLEKIFTVYEKEKREDNHGSEHKILRSSTSNIAECPVCFTEYSGDQIVLEHGCGHTVACKECFGSFFRNKVNEGDVMPWVRCLQKECKEPIYPKDIMKLFEENEKYKTQLPAIFLVKQMQKRMAVRQEWDECHGDNCGFGFLLKARAGKGESQKCQICNHSQIVGAAVLDEEMKKLISAGKLRDCPACGHYSTKDYGICNVICCGKCGIWWNWRTRDTGRTAKALKDKARSAGTLWEPGELQYQMNLQREDPEKFKELLERNGIEYNPHYVRGT